MLPDEDNAQRQVDIVFGLTCYKYDKFGDYDTTFNEWYGHGYKAHMKDT